MILRTKSENFSYRTTHTTQRETNLSNRRKMKMVTWFKDKWLAMLYFSNRGRKPKRSDSKRKGRIWMIFYNKQPEIRRGATLLGSNLLWAPLSFHYWSFQGKSHRGMWSQLNSRSLIRSLKINVSRWQRESSIIRWRSESSSKSCLRNDLRRWIQDNRQHLLLQDLLAGFLSPQSLFTLTNGKINLKNRNFLNPSKSFK